MNGLHRRLQRLEYANGRCVLTHWTDDELDRRLRAELAAWLADEPDACPEPVRAEVLALLADTEAEERRAWPDAALRGVGAGIC